MHSDRSERRKEPKRTLAEYLELFRNTPEVQWSSMEEQVDALRSGDFPTWKQRLPNGDWQVSIDFYAGPILFKRDGSIHESDAEGFHPGFRSRMQHPANSVPTQLLQGEKSA